MSELEKKIQEIKDQREELRVEISRAMVALKIREAELTAVESFVCHLNDLKDKIAKQ